jgi:hypothetical protein
MMSSSIAIISGSDAAYYFMLRGLLDSLRDNPPSFPYKLCIYDLGLTSAQKEELLSQDAEIYAPDWCIRYPGFEKDPEHFKIRVCKPYMRSHFPDFDYYLWLDADLWVQDAGVLNIFIRAAKNNKLAMAAEYDRAYKRAFKRTKLFGWTHNHKHYRLGFGWRIANKFGKYPILNCGVFALAHSSKFWDLWADSLTSALNRNRHPVMEQTAINYEMYRHREDISILPAYCNWLLDSASPAIDKESKMLVEPDEPHQPIGIIHFAGEMDLKKVSTLKTLDGDSVKTRLDYTSWFETKDRL